MITEPMPLFVRITCDKCGHSETSTVQDYNKDFWESGWAMSSNAKKYHHRCRDCQTVKERKAHDFIANKFPQ
jgi:hypothetical protein